MQAARTKVACDVDFCHICIKCAIILALWGGPARPAAQALARADTAALLHALAALLEALREWRASQLPPDARMRLAVAAWGLVQHLLVNGLPAARARGVGGALAAPQLHRGIFLDLTGSEGKAADFLKRRGIQQAASLVHGRKLVASARAPGASNMT